MVYHDWSWMIFILTQYLAHCDNGPSLIIDDHDCKSKGFIINPRINILNPMHNIIAYEYEPNNPKGLIL